MLLFHSLLTFKQYGWASAKYCLIVISSELPEILDVSDRIYVMREGQITGELGRLEATEEKVMRFASLAPQEIP